MGICCGKEDTTSNAVPERKGGKAPTTVPVIEQVKDLPVVSWEGIKDPYERFEKSLPFNRIKIE